MTTIEDILRLTGMAPPQPQALRALRSTTKENPMSHLMEQLLVASGHEPIVDDEVTTGGTPEPAYVFAPEPPLVAPPAPASPEVNLTPLMAEPCFDIASEFLARIQQSNGLDFVDTTTLEDIVDGLLLEITARGLVVSYPGLGHEQR